MYVRKRGKTWEYTFYSAKIDGTRKRIVKGGFATKTDAKKAGTAAEAEYLNTGLAFTPSNVSLTDYLDWWVETYCKVNLADSTVRGYEKKIRLNIKPELGKYMLSNISGATLQGFINDLFNQGLSRNTLPNIKGILSSSFRYAVTVAKFIKVDPMYGIGLPLQRAVPIKPTSKKIRKPVSKDDWDKIINRFPPNHQYHIPICLAYRCGLRLGETFGLMWQDIDFENRVIRINRQVQYKPKNQWYFAHPKYDSYRTIELDSYTCNMLHDKYISIQNNKTQYEDLYMHHFISGYDNTSYSDDMQPRYDAGFLSEAGQKIYLVNVRPDGSYLNANNMMHCFRVIHYELSIKEIDYHSLRHSHTTNLIEAHADIKYVQERLGHKNIETTLGIYAHVTENMAKEQRKILETI